MIRPRHALIPEAYEDRPFYSRLVKGAREEVKIALKARHLPPARKFVIFAQGRTGSTLLTSTLNSHPLIRCDDEILIVPRARPLSFIEMSARVAPAEAYGFHVKITQLLAWQRIRDVAGFLAHMEGAGWTILYLRRENILRHVVSNVFAEAAGGYHISGEGRARPDRITLPLDRLAYEMRLRTELGEAERAALKGRAHTALVYERDLQTSEQQTETFVRLQDAIGVPHANLSSGLRKMVVKTLAELLTNYDEVADWMRRNPDYTYHLEDDIPCPA
ncbi:MAG: hypothetical protein CMF72_00890 [Mameliella sp.]|nr:hypothetical protein [Mameliella sp.]|tara:strand:+ start:13614 stop:14438 length:825 start_codon:yes stop_codon:yes gene_type:complete